MGSSPRLGISHWYSAENLGDLAILTGQLRTMRRAAMPTAVLIGVEPGVSRPAGVDVREFTHAPWPSPKNQGLRGWLGGLLAALIALLAPRSRILPERYRAFSQLVGELDALMPKGGGYLYAQSGLAGAMFTLRVCWPLLLARRLGTSRLVWGHSIGPAKSFLGGLMLRLALQGAHVIVRDDDSVALLDRWRLAHQRAPDLAFGWADTVVPRRRSSILAGGPMAVGLTARIIGPPLMQTAYEDALVGALNDLLRALRAQGNETRLLLCPQVTGPTTGEDDRPVLGRLAARIDGGGELVELSHEDVAAALETYGELDFLIATRLHSAILASCVRVPFIVYEYIGGKARGAARDLGLPEWAVVDRAEDLAPALARGWNEREALTAAMDARLPRIAELIDAAVASAPALR